MAPGAEEAREEEEGEEGVLGLAPGSLEAEVEEAEWKRCRVCR